MTDSLDLHRVVQHHDGQLQGLNTRMSHVETTLGDHGKILRTIESAVTTQGAKPSFDAKSTLVIVKDGALLFAMVCGGILYLASANSKSDLALLNKESTQTAERLGRVESLVLPESWTSKTARR